MAGLRERYRIELAHDTVARHLARACDDGILERRWDGNERFGCLEQILDLIVASKAKDEVIYVDQLDHDTEVDCTLSIKARIAVINSYRVVKALLSD